MGRTDEEVAQAHLRAVVAGDPVAMAADYAPDAVLIRGSQTFRGHAEIAAYFATVPERLGDTRVVFDALRVEPGRVEFDWHLESPAADPAEARVSGTDVCRIDDGAIVHQVVHLVARDF